MKTRLLVLFLIISTASFAQKTERVKKHTWKDKVIRDPQGIWEFYDRSGELEQRYDFTNKTLLFQKKNLGADTVTFRVINGAETILTKLDSPPTIIGGLSTYFNTVIQFRFPAEARENSIQGKVIIVITVDDQGNAIDYKVKEGLGGGMNEESIRVLKLLPYGFIPGVLNGKKVTTEYICPISLKLN